MDQSTLPYKGLGRLKLFSAQQNSSPAQDSQLEPVIAQSQQEELQIMSSKVEMVPEHRIDNSNIPAAYLSRLQGYEDQNKRILRMVQFMIQAGTNQ